MKILVAALFGLAVISSIAFSFQDEALLKPGPEHELLAKRVGTWDAVIIVKDPSGAEVRTKGVGTTTRHASFHTIETFEGELMGMKFEGHGMSGYCPLRKKFFTMWTDSMTPTPLMLFGDYDAKKRELTLAGECFGMSGKLEPCRTVTHYQDDDHYTYALYGKGPDGEEMQQLRIEFTRKK